MPQRLLIVDDDDAILDAAREALRKGEREIVVAHDAASALRALDRWRPDVVLCDVRMPDMSGLELLTKALDLHPGMPVLMLSGVSDVSTARNALHRGAMDYLTKPIELDELDRSVKAAARRRRTLAASHPADTENVELRGGPLDKRRVRIEDSRFMLWVVKQADGQHVWAAINPPTTLPEGSTLLGGYAYSATDNAMHWLPAGV